MEDSDRQDAARRFARLLRLALIAYLITAIPRPRLGDLAWEAAWLTVAISLLLAALTVVTLCLAAIAERIRDWRDARL
jgi:hypothetical protein